MSDDKEKRDDDPEDPSSVAENAAEGKMVCVLCEKTPNNTTMLIGDHRINKFICEPCIRNAADSADQIKKNQAQSGDMTRAMRRTIISAHLTSQLLKMVKGELHNPLQMMTAAIRFTDEAMRVFQPVQRRPDGEKVH